MNADDDHPYIQKIKNDIKLLLYNKRKMVTDNKLRKPNDANEPNTIIRTIENEETKRVIKTPKHMPEELNMEEVIRTKVVMKKENNQIKMPYTSRRAGRPGTKRKTIQRA